MPELSDLSELSDEDESMLFNPLPGVSKVSVQKYSTMPAAIPKTPHGRRGRRSKAYQAKQAKIRDQRRAEDIKRRQELTCLYLPPAKASQLIFFFQ
jgi:hypothetical protein